MRTDYAVKIPYALGLIATRSTTKEVTGLKDLMQQHEVRIRNGMLAYAELEKLRAGDRSPELLASFEKNQKDLGYGLLLKNMLECSRCKRAAHSSSGKRYYSNVTALFSLSVQWLLLAS